MCLILVAWEKHPRFKLVIAANRDEFYQRPTLPATFWEDEASILGGRDLVYGGTWLGISRQSRFAAVTNIREPSLKKPESISRGLLVSDYLRTDTGPESYLSAVMVRRHEYDPFNLLVGNGRKLCFLSSLETSVRLLASGIYGISNGVLDCPWPKVIYGKMVFSEWVEHGDTDNESLFSLLGNNTGFPDKELPDTGVGIELERALSPLFIHTGRYGTRSSTVIMVGYQGEVSFYERTFDDSGNTVGAVSFTY